MFYCKDCRDKHNWPSSISISHGRCEMCGLTRDCYDVPSSRLVNTQVREIVKQVVSEEPLFQKVDPVTGRRNPKPSGVRIVAKSLIVSLNKLMEGEFNPSGKGSKAYHEANVSRSLDYLVKHQHLLTRKLMPSGKRLYPK